MLIILRGTTLEQVLVKIILIGVNCLICFFFFNKQLNCVSAFLMYVVCVIKRGVNLTVMF